MPGANPTAQEGEKGFQGVALSEVWMKQKDTKCKGWQVDFGIYLYKLVLRLPVSKKTWNWCRETGGILHFLRNFLSRLFVFVYNYTYLYTMICIYQKYMI